MSDLRNLAKPFPSRFVKSNPSGGGSYVTHSLYVQRLLLYLGGYDFELVEILRGDVDAIAPNPDGKSRRARESAPALSGVIVGAVARLSVEIDGRPVRIEDVGDCESPHNWPHDGARLKDAMSDALKRCSARIGLGLHLYAKTPDEYVLASLLREREEVAAGPSGGGEPSGQTLVAGNPAGESKDPTVPANPSPAPSELSGAGDGTVSNGGTDAASSRGAVGVPASEFCDACKANDCQHCDDRTLLADSADAPIFCACPHDDGRPM